MLTIAAGKRELVLDPAWASASGFLPPYRIPGLAGTPLGGWITPAISLAPRSPANGPRALSFPGGVLLHTGHPNPGLSSVIRRERAAWRALGLPVIVHLLAQDPRELERMGEQLESIEEIGAMEVNLGEVNRDEIPAWIRAAAQSQIPVIAQFPIGTSADLAARAVQAGAAAVSAGPPRGSLPGPGGRLVGGRVYGPSLLPFGLRTVEEWSARVGAPVLGSGGVTSSAARQAMTDAGASGVELDTILWTEPERMLD
ncbi:MAG: hypothetical protein WD040_01295 [Anaerolineales bacterium]